MDPPSLQHQPSHSAMVTRMNPNEIQIAKSKSYMKTGDQVIKLSVNAEVKHFIAFFIQLFNVCYYF